MFYVRFCQTFQNNNNTEYIKNKILQISPGQIIKKFNLWRIENLIWCDKKGHNFFILARH